MGRFWEVVKVFLIGLTHAVPASPGEGEVYRLGAEREDELLVVGQGFTEGPERSAEKKREAASKTLGCASGRARSQ